MADFRIDQVSAQGVAGSAVPIPEGRSFHSPDGRFEWPGIPSASWTFAASAPGYQPAIVTDVVIASGATADAVFSLRRGTPLSGRVVDPAGAGVPNVTVECRQGAGGTPEAASPLPPCAFAVTDADGRFRLDGLSPQETLTLVASSPAYPDTSRPVEARDDIEVELRLLAGASLSGSVRASGRPAGGVEVRFEELGPQGVLREVGALLTEGDGRFFFDRLKGGRYRIRAVTESGPADRLEFAHEVALGEGEARTGILIDLAPFEGGW